MKNHTSQLILLSLMLATVCSLNLHAHLSSSDQGETAHDLAKVDHDTSAQYTLYRNTLDLIGSHTVLNPPSVIPTSQLPTTSFTSTVCGQMSSVERGMLALDLVLVRSQLDDVRSAIGTAALTRFIYKTKVDLTNQQLLTKTMDVIIASNCSSNANLQATAFQSNLVVDRWILGNIPLSELIQEYTDRSLTNQYVTNCPEDAPWYTPDGCIACNDTEYFNLETEFCEECEDYDWPSHSCVSDFGIMNETNGTNQTVSNAAKVGAETPAVNPSAKNNTPANPNGKNPVVNNSSQNASHPAGNNTKPSGNTTTNPAANKTSDNSSHPAANNTKPSENKTSPAANGTKPSENATHPATNPKNQSGNTTHPAANTTSANASHPATNNTKPSENKTSPAANTTSANASHPATNTTNPSTNASHPAENKTGPSTNATHPAENATKPSGNASSPSTGKETPSNPSSGKETPAKPSGKQTPANPSTDKGNSSVPSSNPNSSNSSNAKVAGSNPQEQSNSTEPEDNKNDTSKNVSAPSNQTKPNTTSPSNQTNPKITPAANQTKPNATAANQTKANSTSPSNQTKPNDTAAANQTKPNASSPSNQTKANTTSPSNLTSPNTTVNTPKPVLPPNSTNSKISDRILLSSPSSAPKQSPSDIPCPETSPFYNGTACIQCNSPHNLFDIAKLQCTTCPDQFNFNSSSNTCEKINNDFLTAKTSANLINAGMSSNYWNYVYDNVKSKNASVKDCPIATPYYNSNLKKCIACAAPTKYFNLDTRQCQGCDAPFVYNETQRDCIDMSQSDHPVAGNALKMSGTIFSHQEQLLQLLHSSTLNARHMLHTRQQ